MAEDTDPADILFNVGWDDMEASRFDEGCPKLERSYQLKPRPRALFTLADCEAQRGRIATAVKRYEEYLKLFPTLPPESKAKQGDRVKTSHAQIAALGPLLPELTLKLPADAPRGTMVRRDGDALAEADIGVAARMDPGEHVVSTQAPGGPLTERKVSLAQGEKRELVVEVAMPPLVERAAPPAPVPAVPHKRNVVPAVMMGGVAAVGVVTGIVTVVLYAGKASEARGLSDAIRQHHGQCYPGAQGQDPSCSKLHDTSVVGDNHGTVSIVGFAIGGAAAIGTLTYLLWPAQRSTASALRVAPTFGPAGGALLASGSF